MQDFTLYPEALALYELEFNEPCIMQWTYAPELIFCTSTWGHPKLKTNKESYSDSGGDCISAPTFSQAFRFFRDKYKLYHDIKMFGDWDEPQYSYIISGKSMSNPAHMWYYKDVKSYPEAELACLRKLIEIVKNKTI